MKRSTGEAIEKMKTAKIPCWTKTDRRMKWILAMRTASLLEERWVMKATGWNLEFSTEYKTYIDVGRPMKRWEDEINEFFRLERTEDEISNVTRKNEWIKTAKDQEGWKKMENKFAIAATAFPGTGHQRNRRTVDCVWHLTWIRRSRERCQAVFKHSDWYWRKHWRELDGAYLHAGVASVLAGDATQQQFWTSWRIVSGMKWWRISQGIANIRRWSRNTWRTDPGPSTKLLSQDQGFYEGRTGEHKSLPHFSFLLLKVDDVFDIWNLRIPFVVRIHLNLFQQQLEYSSFLFYVTAHCRQQCPICTLCQERKAQQSQQILVRGFMTPSLMPVGLGCLTDVGWLFLSVSLSESPETTSISWTTRHGSPRHKMVRHGDSSEATLWAADSNSQQDPRYDLHDNNQTNSSRTTWSSWWPKPQQTTKTTKTVLQGQSLTWVTHNIIFQQ